jgi:transposase-like protein
MKKSRRKQVSKEASDVIALKRKLMLGEVIVEVRAELRELMVRGGMAVLTAMLEDDMNTLCGARYARKQGPTTPRRWGHEEGEVVLGGRKIAVSRPRARSAGKEVQLPTYDSLQREDPLSERTMEQMLIGVSTRKYERSLEDVPDELDQSVVSKSAVSRRFVARSQAQLEVALAKPLTGSEWAALMIDGIHFAEHVVVVVLGIDASGKKHVLGVREGSTENVTLCRALLAGVVERGVHADRSILVVIDGGKGLRKAVTEVFGTHAVVQRCQVHKLRNVIEHLPESKREQVKAALNQAYRTASHEAALRQLENLARTLGKSHPSAAASLREGLRETLTVKELGLTGRLERTFSTTNPIESMNSGIRRVAGRVRRWRDAAMVLRWAVAGALEAEKGFRKLKGHAQMPSLLKALRARDEKTNVRLTG